MCIITKWDSEDLIMPRYSLSVFEHTSISEPWSLMGPSSAPVLNFKRSWNWKAKVLRVTHHHPQHPQHRQLDTIPQETWWVSIPSQGATPAAVHPLWINSILWWMVGELIGWLSRWFSHLFFFLCRAVEHAELSLAMTRFSAGPCVEIRTGTRASRRNC